jgi:phage terminase large subunit
LEVDAEFIPKLKPLFEPHRNKVLYGGRGGVKSWSIARALLIQGFTEPHRILCTREVQKSIKDSVHQLLSDQIIALGMQGFYRVLETEIIGANGTRFLFAGLSTETIQSIKSYEGVTRCWVEEAQVVSKRSWSILIPTIRKPGSEVWVSFNPDLDTDDTWVRFIENTPPDTVLIETNWKDNPWLSPELIAEKDHLQKTDPISFDNVWEGKPRAAAEGAIYAPEMLSLANSGRVRNVPADPMLKTHTVWDLGFNDATAIIFVQRQMSEVRIVDYIEDTHKTILDYANDIKAKGYNLGEAWIPWDGSQERYQLTDPANSPEGLLRKFGLKPRIVPKADVEIGIKKARLVFPRCYFDSGRTVRLRECLKRYRRAIPVSTDEPAKPLHDPYSHGADAFRYLAMCIDSLNNDDPMHGKPIKYDHRGIV